MPSRTRPDWNLSHQATTGDPIISLNEAKKHLRVVHDGQDHELRRAIDRASTIVADALNRALRVGSWRLTVIPPWGWHGGGIRLPRPRFRSLTSVEGWDPDGDAWEAEDVEDYVLVSDAPLAILRPKRDKAWPVGPFRVTYEAGWLPAEAAEAAKLAVLETLAWLDAHRGDETSPEVGRRPNPRDAAPSEWVVYPGP